jgi:hypothetical protein
MNDFRQSLHLLDTHRSLNIRHSVIIGGDRVIFKNHLIGPMSRGIGDAHTMVAEKPETTVVLGIIRRQHAAVTGCDDFSRVEAETGDIAVRLPDFLPIVSDPYFAPDGASRIFYHRCVEMIGNGEDCGKIGGQTHLMHDEDCSEAAGGAGAPPERAFAHGYSCHVLVPKGAIALLEITIDRARQRCWIHIAGGRVYIDKHRFRLTITNGVGRGDERMAYGRHDIAG